MGHAGAIIAGENKRKMKRGFLGVGNYRWFRGLVTTVRSRVFNSLCPLSHVRSTGGKGGAEAKIAALRHAGVDVSKSPAQMGVMIKAALERKAAKAAAYN